MTTVHVFVGQCGNQVGSAFLDTIASEAEASTDAAFQMRVSATHFRPALRSRGANHRRPHLPHESSAADGTAEAVARESLKRSGPQQYYSLSRYTRTENASDVGLSDGALPQPRCVLVDMEPKVIDSALLRANTATMTPSALSQSADVPRRFYTLAPQQCVTRGEGSGNNWAYGYHQQGQSRREAIRECLRRESEQQGTTVTTFHVLHSVAGGTGSGVSCLVAEEIKSMFPSATLLHSVVWPFQCGEVVTQWYNVLMAVSTLRDLADGVCVAFNDAVAADLKGGRANRGFKDAGEVSFPLLNQRISEMLAPLHLPQLLYATPTPQRDASKNRIAGAGSATTSAATSAGKTAVVASAGDGTASRRYASSSDVVEALALDPAMKFFTGVTAPRLVTGSSTWTAVLGEAARTAQHTFTSPNAFPTPAQDAASFYLQNRCCLWSLRGRYASTDGIRELRHIMATSSAVSSPFPLTSLFVSPSEEWRETPSYRGRPDHSATLYGHAPMIGETFAQAATKAEELLNVGAFVHHFERYGVSKAELRDAAAVLYDTAASYGV